ncbi:MAG: L-lactate permease, partial [Actinomyces sp.]
MPLDVLPLLDAAQASFTPSTTAVGGNVFLTAVVGLTPLIAFFVLMGAFKVATHWCSII